MPSSPLSRPEQNQPQPQHEGSMIIKFFKSLLSLGDWMEEALAKINRLTETNYELGVKMAREGRNNDAILRFKVTLWLAPNHEPSMYNLACLYQHKGQKQLALGLFSRIIKANPAHLNAIYRVATLEPTLLKPEMRPTTVPPIQVIEYFNTIAPYYDADREQDNYRLPALLKELLQPFLASNAAAGAQQHLLDLGCGTGLCAAAFQGSSFTNIIGADVSANMLEIAYRKLDQRGVRLYNQLAQQDVRHYLAQSGLPPFDLVIGMCLLPYIGDCSLLAQQLGRAVREGGFVALSFDAYNGAEGFSVLPKTGFFGHSPAYLSQLMQANGFETLRTGEVEAARGQFVQLCFFRKRTTTAATHATPA